ncbi:head-tail connector protein [Rhizobium sp. S163]|uniref:head-tail connector protein n=1 Tax=Rhizobium sp. S163 TaxID=3055039 RepID=UPI0025A9B13F|nr:head-tail connector protein [Rhizobium sp. S163]MDM9647982.1 head-tail connector protein [Rhizobium sp. S163]
MTYALITPPASEPITLAETKSHLRLDDTNEDTLLASLIRTAREHLERTTGLSLIAQTWRLYLDSIPEDGVIQIARGPVQAIESLTLYDAAGEELQLPLTGHILDGHARPARLMLGRAVSPGQPINGIEIDFTAGFGESGAEVPDTLKRAMLMHVAQMFAFRGTVAIEDQPADIPAGYDRLIAPFMVRRL